MEDHNLIASLYPADRDPLANGTIRMRENGSRYCAPQEDTKAEHSSRESTASVEDVGDHDSDGLVSQPKLELTFNSGPKTGQGFVFGTDPNSCDIVLPRLADNKINRRHCCLTFDAQPYCIRLCITHHQ